MNYHEELLGHAQRLCALDTAIHPTQADLRRAVSAAYYALFHFLTERAAEMLMPDAAHRGLVRRAITHTEMRSAATSFKGGNLMEFVRRVCPDPVPGELRNLAQTFLELQDERHFAEYDLDRDAYRKVEVGNLIKKVERAIGDWKELDGQPIAKIFLAALLLQNKWARLS